MEFCDLVWILLIWCGFLRFGVDFNYSGDIADSARIFVILMIVVIILILAIGRGFL